VTLSDSSLRHSVEEFLYHEVMLLDEWRLTEWLELFTKEGSYIVPPLDCRDATDDCGLFLVNDDRQRLGARISQLQGASAWAENPPSRIRHIVTNVLVERLQNETVRCRANFVVYRFRHEAVDAYIGSYNHRLLVVNESYRFIERRAILDLEALRPHGKLSFIL
jgi:p-cumate 2,3-dioxygenase subunit beta